MSIEVVHIGERHKRAGRDLLKQAKETQEKRQKDVKRDIDALAKEAGDYLHHKARGRKIFI